MQHGRGMMRVRPDLAKPNSSARQVPLSKLIIAAPSRRTTATPHTMQSLRRTAVTAARTGRTTLSRQTRRYAHDEHHAHGHAAPANEPMGVRPPTHCARRRPSEALRESPHAWKSNADLVVNRRVSCGRRFGSPSDMAFTCWRKTPTATALSSPV